MNHGSKANWNRHGVGIVRNAGLYRAVPVAPLDWSLMMRYIVPESGASSSDCRNSVLWSSLAMLASVWRCRSEEQRLNSSHRCISYAVFCLKKKKKEKITQNKIV